MKLPLYLMNFIDAYSTNLAEGSKRQVTQLKNHRALTVQGKKFASLEEVSRVFGIHKNTLDYRLSKKWTPEQAVGIEPPPSFASKTAGIPVLVNGLEFPTLKAAAKHYNRAYTHVIEMMKKGRTVEQSLGLVKRSDTLASVNPDLAKQWHPSKNLELKPEDLSSGSGRKVWWLCSKGHEWNAVVNSRNRGMGCPYCAGQLATPERNFATEYPELLMQWNYEFNIGIDPRQISPRANKKVYWKCEKGHSWQATVLNKTRAGYNGDCPYCLNRKVSHDNNLAQLRPEIAQDWHPTKNGSMTPKNVIAGGYNKVWWICKHGHEYQATVGSRVHSGTGCPSCSNQTSRIEIAVFTEMSALFTNVKWREKVEGFECDILVPELKIAVELDGVHWHKNSAAKDLKKQDAFARSGLTLYRLREQGLNLISERDISFLWSDNTYPIVSQLIGQILIKEKLEGEISIRLKNYLNEGKLLNEALYRKLVAQLPAPPFEKSLAFVFPEIAKEWASDLNAPLSPEHFLPGSTKKVFWRCNQGHVWQTTLNHRTGKKGTNCPQCPRETEVKVSSDWSLLSVYPSLSKEWNYELNKELKPENVRPKSNRKVWWKCKDGHDWEASVSSRAGGTGCPFCSGRLATNENCLSSLYPDLLIEWEYELNAGLLPGNMTPSSNRSVWWKCKADPTHKWKTSVYNRAMRKAGCPHCVRKRARKSSIEDLQAFAQKHGGLCLSEEFISSRKKLKMKCVNGHIFETRADNITFKKRWFCPHCKGME